MEEREKYINEMAKQMLNNNLALFIGAGFSNIFEYPSWGGLLKDIIDEYQLSQNLKSTSLFSFVEETEFENAEKINNKVLERLLGVDYLKLARYIDYILQEKHGISIHKAVADKILKYEQLRRNNEKTEYLIGFFKKRKQYLEDMITTNYDSNIEYCFDNEVSVIHRNLKSLDDISFKNKLFKIHGCISDDMDENVSSIIITEKDYNNFKNKNKYLFYKIYSFFTEKKIVFMGYSINDPNIRSLLNDVIEENNGKVGLQIYWVTRDKLKDLDKRYYEDYFKLKIIEEIEIIELFRELDSRIETNIILKEAVKADLTEYCKTYIDNYSDISFIEDIKQSCKTQEVLQCLYNFLIEDEMRNVLNPYFYLLSKSDEDIIMRNKLSIQNIIEMQNSRIFKILDLVDSNTEIKSFIELNNFVEIVLDSLIEYSRGNHPFGGYADSIKYLLLAYSLFNDETKEKGDEFIEALSSNIIASCSNNPRYIGYDWRGLSRVEESIKLLDEEDLIKLIDNLSRNYIDKIRSLQLEYVINYSSLKDEDKTKVLYKKLYKKQIDSSLYLSIKSAMRIKLSRQYGFENIKDDTYILDNHKIDLQIKDYEFKTIYELKNLEKNENLVMITQELDEDEIEVSFNSCPKRFNNYSEFEKNEEGIQNEIEEIIDIYIEENEISKITLDK